MNVLHHLRSIDIEVSMKLVYIWTFGNVCTVHNARINIGQQLFICIVCAMLLLPSCLPSFSLVHRCHFYVPLSLPLSLIHAHTHTHISFLSFSTASKSPQTTGNIYDWTHFNGLISRSFRIIFSSFRNIEEFWRLVWTKLDPSEAAASQYCICNT